MPPEPPDLVLSSSRVTINSSGVLDLNGFKDTAVPLTLDGGQITTGAGHVWLSGTVTVLTNADTTATINGNAYLYDPVVITNAGHSSSPDLIINAIISGDTGNGITKTGAGEVRLNAANTFSGPVTVNAGELAFWNSSGLGNTNTPATVNSGGTLHVAGNLTIGNKPLVLNGPGWAGSAIRWGPGRERWGQFLGRPDHQRQRQHHLCVFGAVPLI